MKRIVVAGLAAVVIACSGPKATPVPIPETPHPGVYNKIIQNLYNNGRDPLDQAVDVNGNPMGLTQMELAISSLKKVPLSGLPVDVDCIVQENNTLMEGRAAEAVTIFRLPPGGGGITAGEAYAFQLKGGAKLPSAAELRQIADTCAGTYL
jgi:hypothetical protein